MNYQTLTGKSIREGFEIFHKMNPRIYSIFERLTLSGINLGKKRMSAKLLINTIRWKNSFAGRAKENYKINDAFGSYYARMFAEKHPDKAYIFEYRKLRNEKEAPRGSNIQHTLFEDY